MRSTVASTRYEKLSSDRTEYLNSARDCAALTLPYLLKPSGHSSGGNLPTPFQSIGAKGANVMASKLMLALFPVNTSFFKLQVSDGEFVADPELNATMKSEIDQALAKMERIVNQSITGSMDRVVLTNAVRHAVVTGNGLLFDSKKGLKFYPMDRFVIERDGNGRPVEIITVEGINEEFLPKDLQEVKRINPVDDSSGGPSGVTEVNLDEDEKLIYTWAKVKDGKWRWHQVCEGYRIKGSEGECSLDAPAWIPVRFNVVDGENYGRGRVEEFIGDLASLNSLAQSMVEGSAVAARILFLLSPGAVTKPLDFAKAQNGDILMGRPEDLLPVVTGKQADFATVFNHIQMLTKSLSEAFLILSVRQSERTTAEEVRAVQQEVMEQLGGILGTLTSEVAVPFLKRRLSVLQRAGKLPALPKGLVLPTVVAGLDGVGRGQDREALLRVATTIQQILGPEIFVQKVSADEFLKRLFASEGIDPLELLISPEEQQASQEAAQQQATQQSLVDQAGQIAKAPLMDPNSNPNVADAFQIDPSQVAAQSGAGGTQPPAN